jgi:hypothetical protein
VTSALKLGVDTGLSFEDRHRKANSVLLKHSTVMPSDGGGRVASDSCAGASTSSAGFCVVAGGRARKPSEKVVENAETESLFEDGMDVDSMKTPRPFQEEGENYHEVKVFVEKSPNGDPYLRPPPERDVYY